jgi:hypothetical protein
MRYEMIKTQVYLFKLLIICCYFMYFEVYQVEFPQFAQDCTGMICAIRSVEDTYSLNHLKPSGFSTYHHV